MCGGGRRVREGVFEYVQVCSISNRLTVQCAVSHIQSLYRCAVSHIHSLYTCAVSHIHSLYRCAVYMHTVYSMSHVTLVQYNASTTLRHYPP